MGALWIAQLSIWGLLFCGIGLPVGTEGRPVRSLVVIGDPDDVINVTIDISITVSGPRFVVALCGEPGPEPVNGQSDPDDVINTTVEIRITVSGRRFVVGLLGAPGPEPVNGRRDPDAATDFEITVSFRELVDGEYNTGIMEIDNSQDPPEELRRDADSIITIRVDVKRLRALISKLLEVL